MKTAEEIIVEITKLDLEEQQKVAAFMISIDFSTQVREIEAFPLEEDDDVGLEEDIAASDRAEEEALNSKPITHEEMIERNYRRLLRT